MAMSKLVQDGWRMMPMPVLFLFGLALEGQEKIAGGKRTARGPRSTAGVETSPEGAAGFSEADAILSRGKPFGFSENNEAHLLQ
jgi:hypothetical protein